jgi:hypothetical protein
MSNMEKVMYFVYARWLRASMISLYRQLRKASGDLKGAMSSSMNDAF